MRKAAPELARFLAAFGPDVARVFRATRAAVLHAAPQANELVYDAYNAVTIAFTFTDRLSEAFVHIAAYTKHVNLGFNHGAALPDPERLLAGSGARIRHARIARAADLERPAIAMLLRAAVAQGRALARNRTTARARSVVRPTTGAKRRPKRAATTRPRRKR
ncbi:MAG: DUF1801 domain-containing protein [Gammaproteobacteria bacterium]|nr:DUF1801 domain-containing protein [Gammaproteobacteria bacterium]